MNKEQFLSNIPAFLSDFQESKKLTDNKYVTHAKLRAFYQGTTDDGRTFTEEFANKLLPSIYYTPVVGYYSEKDKDFLGHNSTQYVYGIVPGESKIEFEEVDGKKWAVTDVLLFTGRNDNIGEIAKKIIGRQHSLELDPDTVDYEMKLDKNGKIKEIVFKEGSFIGLSVVGDKQKPAFKGSSFFTSQEVQDALNEFTKCIQNGGSNMNENINLPTSVESYKDFLAKSYSELAREAAQDFYAWMNESEGVWVENMFVDNTVIAYFYANLPGYEAGNYYKFMRNEDKSFSLLGQVWLHFLTQEEINKLSGAEFVEESATENNEPVPSDEAASTENVENHTEGEEPEATTEPTEDSPEAEVPAVESEDNGDVGNEGQEAGQEAAEQQNESVANAAALADQERQELEAYRDKEKLEIIAKYSSRLTDEEVQDFTNKRAEFSAQTLTQTIAAILLDRPVPQAVVNETPNVDPRQPVFQTMARQEQESENDLQSLVNRYKNKA